MLRVTTTRNEAPHMESFPPPPPPPPTAYQSSYPDGQPPTSLQFDPPETINRWRPLVQWFLAIPHLIIAYVLGLVSEVLAFVAWFIIVFTGRLPEGLANLQAMCLRYTHRVNFYAGFLVAEYPPFTFDSVAADPGDMARVRVDFRPQLENRNRLTVAFRLILIIPVILWLVLIGIAAAFVYLIAFFAVLFTGKWPSGMRDFVLSVVRYSLRVSSYMTLLDDQYPGFSLG
jgi:hypothetical protein